MFHGVRFSGLHELEDAVTVAQYATIHALLTAGYNVVSDSTWLNEDDFQRVRTLAENVGADFEIWDMRDIPLEVCIERDVGRGALVGAEVITGMYQRYVSGMAPRGCSTVGRWEVLRATLTKWYKRFFMFQ